MISPLCFEQDFAWRQQNFAREAAAERRARLAQQARGPRPGVRRRLAGWLFHVALWLAAGSQPQGLGEPAAARHLAP